MEISSPEAKEKNIYNPLLAHAQSHKNTRITMLSAAAAGRTMARAAVAPMRGFAAGRATVQAAGPRRAGFGQV
jgi:hypothetical protein